MEILSQAISKASKLIADLERQRAEMEGCREGQAAFDDALASARQILVSLQQSDASEHEEDQRV